MARIAGALVLALAAVACGEDGKGIGAGDHCPEIGLYQYQFVPGTGGTGGNAGHWELVKPGYGGQPGQFTQAELDQLNKNIKEATQIANPNGDPTGQRCLTPNGEAVTLDVDGGP
ncbi:MAG TPA: hypothetical protein VHE30_28160 [Polyangiaceae bacterium]|nr:hypothetical protein [Polyangiaceae bacterium]